jgi:hypothetical protein
LWKSIVEFVYCRCHIIWQIRAAVVVPKKTKGCHMISRK